MQTDLTLRQSYGRALSILIGVLGDFDAAEDALHCAVEKALVSWKTDPPDHPVSWLIRAARNASIDQFRRKQVHERWVELTHPLMETGQLTAPLDDGRAVEDDFLRLIFTCCHPALARDAQIVLALRSLLGFDIPQIADALLISESAAQKRLVRVRQKINAAGIQYEIPAARRLPQRLSVVCDVIYLLFNEGYSRPGIPRDIDLCLEAIRLARTIASMFRRHQDTQSLLALLLISQARLKARYDEAGAYVPLEGQDRNKWDWVAIREGVAILDRIFHKRLLPTSFQLQAAISACHCRSRSPEDTDWAEIAELYGRLEHVEPSPVVRINRAVALIRAEDADRGAAILSSLEETGSLSGYQPFHAARAYAHLHFDDLAEAARSFRRAIALTESEPERLYLEKRLSDVLARR